MSFRIPSLRVLALPALLVGLFLAACHLGDGEKVEATISFNQIFDSLVQYDTVLISLKDKDGNTIDVVFHGRVLVPGDVEKLPAPHWDGGKITVSIIGYKDGKIAYRTETGFDGAGNKKDSTYVFVSPTLGLTSSLASIPMLEGDSIPFPPITITPANLKVKDLNWVSSAPDVVRIGTTGLKALKAGNTQITISLAADPAKTFVIAVTVVDPAKIPESLSLAPDTLNLMAGGATKRFAIQFVPTLAAKDVIWSSLDTTVATIVSDGTVTGVKAGETKVVVVSTLKAAVADTALVLVTNPQPPISVAFSKAETEIFVGGAAESLLVTVLPPEALQEVDFTVTSPGQIEIKNGRISGLAEGDGYVIAKSRENPLLMDSLKVKVTVRQVVESVTMAKKTITVFTGGDEPILTASILPPTSNQKVQWRVGNGAIATVTVAGKLTGLSPGHTRIYAISLVDSTKQDSADVYVKTDAPVVNIGRPDTTVSVGASVTFLPVVPVQEFGVVVAYRWDVDGVPGWDDTAKAVQPVTVKFDAEKDYVLRFLVRDSEGNETIATKKVSAVIGPVVNIVSPANGAYFTKAPIKIEWTIDNVTQASGTDTVLKDGPNVITRIAKDAAGKVFSNTITVYLDSVPPAKPIVKGPAAIASGKPTWTWSPGGGGNGSYRFAVDSLVFAGAGSKDTLYIPEPALTEGSHALYVQERDAAGNWSLPGSIITVVDASGPAKPTVKTNVASPTNAKRPVWSWSTGGGGAGVYQYKLGNADFSTGASTPALDSQYIPAANLGDATYTLYVRERDAIGNWSEPGSAALTVDTTAPGKPVLVATSPTSVAPKWAWTSGGGGSGTFRFKVGGEPSGSPETVLREYTLAGAVTKTLYTLYVQERDAAGNWSPASDLGVFFDLSKPSVAFTAPKDLGTYMTKSATVDVSGTSTSPEGGGAIKTVTYTVNGAAGTVPVTLAGDGSWSIKALPLTNNTLIALKVTATNEANNTGEATLSLLMDNTAPAAPAFTAQPNPPTVNKNDLRTSLAWTWGAVAGADSFIVKVNGAEVARQTGTTYAINSLAEGAYLVEVAAKDLTGNASAFTPAASVLVDRIAPGTPAFSAQPPTVVNNGDTRTSLQWTWTRTGAATDSFLVNLNGSPVSRQTGASYSVTPIPDGTYQLEVVEKDLAGNPAGPLTSGTVTVDRAAPGAPAFTAQPNPAIVNKVDPRTSLSWTWSRTGAATDSFVVRLNGTEVARQTGTGYTVNSIPDGDYLVEVSEKDLSGNASGFTAATKVLVDRVSPSVPDLSQPPTPRKTAQWTWTGGGGGNGTFKCVLDGGTEFTCSSPYTLPSPFDGDHTLRVRELDAAGNASANATTTVTIDLQSPTISRSNYLTVPTQIGNSFGAFTGTASDDRGLKLVTYKIGTGAPANAAGTSNWNFTPAFGTGTQTLTITVEDQAGNTASTQVDITYQRLAVFVRKEAGGTGDGSSWQNAYKELAPLLKGDRDFESGTQFWVAEGAYSAADENGFILRPNSSVYGGFASEGTDRSLAVRNTSLNISTLNAQVSGSGRVVSNLFERPGLPVITFDNILLSDFELGSAFIAAQLSDANKITLNKIRADGKSYNMGIYLPGTVKLEMVDCAFTSNTVYEGFLYLVGDAYARVKNTDFNFNKVGSGSGTINIGGGSVCASGSTRIAGYNSDDVSVGAWGGTFSRESSVTIDTKTIGGTSTVVGACPAPF